MSRPIPPETVITPKLEAEVFDYLDALRESGVTNMFGAAPHVVREFRINIIDARALLSKWMATFTERKTKSLPDSGQSGAGKGGE